MGNCLINGRLRGGSSSYVYIKKLVTDTVLKTPWQQVYFSGYAGKDCGFGTTNATVKMMGNSGSSSNTQSTWIANFNYTIKAKGQIGVINVNNSRSGNALAQFDTIGVRIGASSSDEGTLVFNTLRQTSNTDLFFTFPTDGNTYTIGFGGKTDVRSSSTGTGTYNITINKFVVLEADLS